MLSELHHCFKGRQCKVYANDLRVRIKETDYTYPDVVAICGEVKFADQHHDTLLNPTVIIEVLSASIESYDRGKKFELYRRLASLQEYLLIAQNRCYIEHYVRQGKQWLLTEIQEGKLILKSAECELWVSDIYDKVM